ncbi:unnamed protein product [Kuraishia capsulata CBS 1993]|uniref:Uncharacterized protein n=1 Tax=Kuraishia capsulata CBS 1993 TaxID=1382522 RepID=W6MGP3_9ASCO|nr:uncharacterized protein KUCA_T00001303001 [Kuraishia capsulata CBS 1993]CDK25334.1 unnamed protein product [Kuraishia capsulata CBS 1993]
MSGSTPRPRSHSISAQLPHRIQLQNAPNQQVQQQKPEPVLLRNIKPPKLLQSENYETFFDIIGQLIAKVSENRELKTKILRDCETISSYVELNKPLLGKHSVKERKPANGTKKNGLLSNGISSNSKSSLEEGEADPNTYLKSIYRYQQELQILEEQRLKNGAERKPKIKSFFKSKPISDGSGMTPKQKKIINLRNERENLLILLHERVQYNGALVEVLEEFEANISLILKNLHGYIVTRGEESMVTLRAYCEEWDLKKREVYGMYLELIESRRECVDLFNSVSKMMNEMDENEEMREIELRLKEENFLRQK